MVVTYKVVLNLQNLVIFNIYVLVDVYAPTETKLVTEAQPKSLIKAHQSA